MTKILLTRQQLAQFLPNHETIKEFENLFNNSNDLTDLINRIIVGTGLATDGNYVSSVTSNYINSASSLYSADLLLDSAIYNNVRELITPVSTSSGLLSISQTVLCDATIGAMNITLPPPASCFSGNRSLKIGISKIDTTSNIITILPNATELIVGEASQSINSEGDILNFITDGTNWYLQN